MARTPIGSNQVIERQLREGLVSIEGILAGDVLAYLGPVYPFAADWIKYGLETIEGEKSRTLFVFLETNGGYVESAERIANVLRHHYKRVEFLVPSFAMSAGTVLVMSGDAIHMDYSSVLGPIDPQIQREPNQAFIPALGYIEKFNELVDKSAQGQLTMAELHWMVQRFDPGELYRIEQEQHLSISLLKKWLVTYKFSGWKRTRTQGKKVTPKMREQRAEEIATELNNTKRWHSHGRGITMSTLVDEMNLEIENFGARVDLDNAVREYFLLLKDYMMRVGHQFALHTREGYNGV